MPDVLYRPPKLPDAANEHEAAKAIRRSYCSSWLAAVACALGERSELRPLPRNRRLSEQLGKRVQGALADPYHRDHELAVETRRAYHAQRERRIH